MSYESELRDMWSGRNRGNGGLGSKGTYAPTMQALSRLASLRQSLPIARKREKLPVSLDKSCDHVIGRQHRR